MTPEEMASTWMREYQCPYCGQSFKARYVAGPDETPPCLDCALAGKMPLAEAPVRFLERLRRARAADQLVYGMERAVHRAGFMFDSSLVCLLVDNAEKIQRLLEACEETQRANAYFASRLPEALKRQGEAAEHRRYSYPSVRSYLEANPEGSWLVLGGPYVGEERSARSLLEEDQRVIWTDLYGRTHEQDTLESPVVVEGGLVKLPRGEKIAGRPAPKDLPVLKRVR